MGCCGPIDLEYEPENERSSDLDHNKGKSSVETGFIPDENGDFYADSYAGRKNTYGQEVTGQDGKSFPGPRGLVNI